MPSTQAKKKIEDEMADKAPGSIKPFFPCCGGPVGTMEKCICMVPADQQEQVKSAIDTQWQSKATSACRHVVNYLCMCDTRSKTEAACFWTAGWIDWTAKEKYKNI